MADTKSIQVLLAEIKTFLRAKNPYLDVSENSLIQDLILTPYSVAAKLVLDQVEAVKNLHILSEISGQDLENEASNFNLVKLPGDFATASLTFYAATAPTEDVVIPADAQVRTTGTAFSNAITFEVDAENRFAVSDVGSYYSFDRGRYEFTVTATATTRGVIGNVASNFLTSLVTNVDQIEGVTNLSAATGGTDEESDDDLRERVRLYKTGRALSTRNGLSRYLRGLGFVDAEVIRAEEEGYERANGVDAFVVDYSTDTQTDTFNYNPAQTEYYLTKRPVLAVTSVTTQQIGALTTSQYSANVDETSPLRRSYYAQDYVSFNTLPIAVGSQISVTYTYVSRLHNSQATINQPAQRVLTAGILLKRAYPLSLTLNATLTLKANADGPSTRNTVRNALSQYVSEQYRLGDGLQKSDLIIVLQQGYGDFPVNNVDAVTLNSYLLTGENGTVYQPVNEQITISNKQHIVYGSAVVV